MSGRLSDLWSNHAAFGVSAALTWERSSIDFSALANASIDRSLGTVTVGAYSWSQSSNATTYLDALDVVAGTGLVADFSAINSTPRYRATTSWWLALALTQVWPDFDPRDPLVIRAILGGRGDASNDEQHGVGYGNGRSTTLARWSGVTIGHFGAAGAMRLSGGQSPTLMSDAETPKGSFDCVQLENRVGCSVAYAGITSSGAYPASWTAITNTGAAGSTEFTRGQGAADGVTDFFGSTPELVLCGGPGNTSNNFSPSWKRIDLYRARLHWSLPA